jgi:hypothetical protein
MEVDIERTPTGLSCKPSACPAAHQRHLARDSGASRGQSTVRGPHCCVSAEDALRRPGLIRSASSIAGDRLDILRKILPCAVSAPIRPVAGCPQRQRCERGGSRRSHGWRMGDPRQAGWPVRHRDSCDLTASLRKRYLLRTPRNQPPRQPVIPVREQLTADQPHH